MSKQNENLQSIIEHFYHWEKTTPNKVFLRQPKGDIWHTVTWAEAGQIARKMTTALPLFFTAQSCRGAIRFGGALYHDGW